MKGKEIRPSDIWDKEKLNKVKAYIDDHADKQPNEKRIETQLLAITYRLEDYIENDNIKEDQRLNALNFVKMYLSVLGITKEQLAKYFGMDASNLHKYLVGDRKLSHELAMKISSFTHTKPDYWYRLQVKNDIAALSKERGKDFEKYDYKGLLQAVR